MKPDGQISPVQAWRRASEAKRRADNAEFLKRGRRCLGDLCRSSNKNGLIRTPEMFKLGHAVCDLCAATMAPETVAAADASAGQTKADETHPQIAPMSAEKSTKYPQQGEGGSRVPPGAGESDSRDQKGGDSDARSRKAKRHGAPPTRHSEPPAAAPETTPPPAPVDVEKLKCAIGGAVLELVVGNLCEHCAAMLLDKLRKGA